MISEGLKFKIFLGGRAPRPPYVTRFAHLLRFLVGALRTPLRYHDLIAQKRSTPDQTKIASYGPVAAYETTWEWC